MIGILFAFISSILLGIALFIQKISLIKITKWKQVFKSPKWLLSIFLTFISFCFSLLALKFERLIIIQPISNVSLLVIVLLEIFVLKDKISIYEILSIILFFIGSLFITNTFCNIFNVLCGYL
jgi:uncharacterized membrane protein